MLLFHIQAVSPIITIIPDTSYTVMNLQIKISSSKETEISLDSGSNQFHTYQIVKDMAPISVSMPGEIKIYGDAGKIISFEIFEHKMIAI